MRIGSQEVFKWTDINLLLLSSDLMYEIRQTVATMNSIYRYYKFQKPKALFGIVVLRMCFKAQ